MNRLQKLAVATIVAIPGVAALGMAYAAAGGFSRR